MRSGKQTYSRHIPLSGHDKFVIVCATLTPLAWGFLTHFVR